MDKMSEYLDKTVAAYLSVNHTWCFNHILNLTGRALLRQFDIKKKLTDDDTDSDQVLSAEEQELLELAEGIDVEEHMMAQESGDDSESRADEEVTTEDLEELDEGLD